MNKVKNIYRTLILLLSLVLMPVEGWGATAVLTKDATTGYYKLDLKDAFLDANNNYSSYKYKFYRLEFRDNTDKSISDLSSWVIKYGNPWSANDVSSEASSNCYLYKNSDNYFFDGNKGQASQYGNNVLYFTPPTDVNLEGAKIVLHLSNDEGFLTDATKEQATYTYNVRLAGNLTDYSVKEASEPTNVISKKSVVDQNNAQARVKLDVNDVKYMRWQVLDKDGSVISSVSSLLTGETATNYQVVKDKYVWAKFDNWEPNNIAQESDRTVTFNLPSGKTWDDGYQVVCYWATDKSDGDFYSDGSKVYFFHEPTLSGKCVFSFMSKTAAESATFTPNTSSNVQKTTEIRTTSDASFTISMPNTAKYMRWYVADKDGNVVDALTPDGSATANTYVKKGNYYIWYNSDKETSSNDLKMTFTLPNGKSWTDGYQVICAWASSSAGSDILYDNSNNYYLLKEPNLSGLYVTAFTTAEQIKSKDLTLSSLSKIAVDESDVYMVNDGIEQVTVTIPKHSVKYVRWQLIDMTTGQIVDAVGENGNSILNNSYFTNRKKGSFVYYNATSSSNSPVRQITFDKSQITGAGEWSNYQLKAVWTDNVDGIDAPTLDTNPFVVAEPSVLQGAYTVNFKTVAQATADMKLSSALSSNVISESDNFAVSGSKVTVTVPTHYLRYIRWQVIDKTTGKVIEDLPDGTLSSSSTYNRGKGNVIAYSETSVSNENLRTITFDKSKLSTSGDWKNYQLKAVWTNDVTGMTSYINTDGTRYVVSEPSVMQGVYTVSFADKSAVGTLVTSPDPTTTVKEVDGVLINNLTPGNEAKRINVNLNHKLDEILSVLGKSSVSKLGNLYIRWTVTDGNSFKTNGFGISNKKYNDFDNNKYFNVLTKDPSSELSDLLKVSFAPTSELHSFDITKVTNISCVITDDIEGLKETDGIVTKEPTSLKLKYQVNIVDPTNVPFRHYKGYANADGDYEVIDASKGQLRQKTYTWEYTYPVEVGKPVALTLPLEKYATEGNPLEPLGYFRWYNYDTDMASENLKADDTTGGSITRYQHELKDEEGNCKGIFAYNLPINTNAWQGNVGVDYTRPGDASWEGETIACDVSRYVDGIDATSSYMEHESTLSVRYIFHLIPAKQMADMEKDYLTNSNNDLTYEDNKNVTVGFANNTSTMTLRLNMKPTMYYFYPMTNPKHHVYFPTGQSDRDIVAEDFGKELKKATKVIWRIYNGDKDRYFERESNVSGFPRFFDVSQDVLNSASAWKDLDGKSVTGNITFNYGDHFSVVAYAVADDNSSCPIANFNCRFFGFHPMMDSEMGIEDVQRKISYLEENYNRVALISFDNDSPEQTLAVPTNDMDNQSEHPSDWSKRNYGFVYKNLMSKSATHTGSVSYYDPMHSPLHGEYGIYKTANVTGVSTNSDKYLWHHTGTELHDRTWELTGGSQTGSFLYVDASDESRTIASAEFNANLCTGQQMAFSAYVADMTDRETKPQLMFKLYGLVGNQKVLLHNFSSGDFESNRDTKDKGKWYQVYGKITIQKEAHAEQYDKFRIEIDNYSEGTQGADYAVDDIRIYSKPAKIEVYQDRPACGSSTTGNIKLKVRAIHETLNALLGHKNTTIHFRFVNEDGSPVNGTGFYNYTLKKPGETVAQDITTDKDYASVDVFDSEETCAKYEIDGVNMIEKDADGETYIILANHQFALTKGKKYYVSVCTDSNPDAADAKWSKPSDVCSIYSDLFELIGQTPAITDTDGKVITEYRVDCAATDPSVTLKGSLTTIDPKTGEKITLTGVPFFWYIDQATTPYKSTALKEITIPISDINYGAHTVYMKPEPNEKNADGEDVYTTPDGVSYLLCNEAVPVPLRIAKDGPQLNFGFNDVDYPFNDNSYEASLRIGLPQLKKLKEKLGYLQVPIHDVSYLSGVTDKTLTFIDDSKTEADKTSADVYVATTNDPLWNAEGATLLSNPVATLSSKTLDKVNSDMQYTLNLKFSDDVLENFHEGYYYELRFVFEQGTASAGTANCPGESYLKVKIVPEFITWTPTADGGMNANWNNDDNWHRSSSTELHDNEYHDYQAYGSASGITPKVDIPTLNSYVPMKFTKVTIDNLKGLPFPDLGNIVYRTTNQIATKLTNGKGNEATKYIQYDIMAFWDEAAADKGLEKGNLKCEKFYGNTCHQIYFKPQGELRDQCYLVYDKAWVEKELVPNKWYTMASPLQYIYAGDMYVPASNGRQETKAFTDINFDTNVNSRSKYPVYQRAWMKSDVKEITPDSEPDYDAWHKPAGAPSTVDMNLGYWSHVYNKVDESYSADGTFGGFSIKAGNALLPKDQTTNALLRLPKADNEYQYFDYNGNENSSSKTRVAKDAGHGKLLVAFNNDEKHLAEKFQTLGDNASGFYLVANPYTCSISMAKFFEANTGLQNAIWIVENGEVKAISSTELGKQNYAIQPTQSFFVKKNASATIREVRFTSTMCVDRTITPGLLMASDYVKTVEVETENSNGQTSKARIALRQEASADYDDEEDVDLLYDQNLKDIPQVYTVAGNEAVAVNAVPELSWIPLGIVSQQAEEVSLTLKGLNKLDAPVYLYDAASASYTELHDGEAVKVKAGDHGRYFLTQTRTVTSIDRIEAEEQNAPVKVYSPAAGMIVVSALGGEKLDKVQVFTLDGKKVHSYQLPDKQRMILRVPSGVYIVKASTQSCAQAKGQKVAVR